MATDKRPTSTDYQRAGAALVSVSAPLIGPVWPIYRAAHRSLYESVASSILLRVADHWFLLTAAHVLNEGRTEQLYLGIGNHVVPLQGRSFSTAADVGAPDLAVCFLDEQLVRDVGSPDHIKPADILVVPQTINPDVHIVIGFPHSKQPKKITAQGLLARPMTHAGHLLSPERARRLGYDPTLHLLIEFDKDTAYGAEGRMMAPDPYGVSGGGIWAVPDLLLVDKPATRFAGIAIEWRHEGKCLVGTRVQPCLALIARELPLVAPLLQ